MRRYAGKLDALHIQDLFLSFLLLFNAVGPDLAVYLRVMLVRSDFCQ